ncbi:MAG: flippase-like domain-containing protein [Candidatus Marinimicrobia bacterium]|nr:flippase-like domain-containing protein [Candidatus Neomarinimicrobiota bacterium]
MKNKIFQIGGLLISALAVWYAFRGIQWDTVGAQIHSINLAWYTLTLLLMILSIYVRAFRWQFIIKPIGKAKVYPLYKSVMIGYFGNNVLPLRLGELLRAYVASKATNIPVVKVLPTIVADRILDLLSFFIVFLVMSLGMTLPEWAGETKFWLIIMMLLLLIILYIYKRLSYRITLWLSDRQSRIFSIIKELHLSMASLFKMDDYWKIFLSSMLLWFIYGFHYYVGFQAFGFELGIGEAALVLAASTFAVSIPSAPGALGTYHSSLIAILTLLTIEKSTALAFAVMMHLSGFVPITILGAIYFWQSGVSIKDLK